MRAYILIDTPLDNAERIAGELRKRSVVLLADIVNGPCPVIALIEGDDPSTIAQTVLFDIRKMEGVADLTVYLSREGQEDTKVQDNIPDMPCLALPDSSQAVVSKIRSRSRKGGEGRSPNV